MITVTQTAAERITKMLASRGKGIGIRIGVKTTGCSGLAYILEYVDELQNGDEVFESLGCTIIIDKKSLVYLFGLEIDYTKKGLNEGFDFRNPNEKDRCGCGESFRI